jgi:hypothetical protein
MKSLKTYLILTMIITVVFMYLGMYNEIVIHYKSHKLSTLIGLHVRHLNHNFYTGFYILSLVLLSAGYLIISFIHFVKTRIKADK